MNDLDRSKSINSKPLKIFTVHGNKMPHYKLTLVVLISFLSLISLDLLVPRGPPGSACRGSPGSARVRRGTVGQTTWKPLKNLRNASDSYNTPEFCVYRKVSNSGR